MEENVGRVIGRSVRKQDHRYSGIPQHTSRGNRFSQILWIITRIHAINVAVEQEISNDDVTECGIIFSELLRMHILYISEVKKAIFFQSIVQGAPFFSYAISLSRLLYVCGWILFSEIH